MQSRRRTGLLLVGNDENGKPVGTQALDGLGRFFVLVTCQGE